MVTNSTPVDGIKVTVGNKEFLLGAYHGRPVQHVVPRSGLKIASYDLPEHVTDRNAATPSPVLTLLQRGSTCARLRYDGQEVDANYQAGDLMCYRGGMELQFADWTSRNARLISVEIDAVRLAMLENGDTHFPERLVAGSPRFNDPELAAVMQALWDETQCGSPRGTLYSDSLSLGLAARVYQQFSGRPATDSAQCKLSTAQLRRIEDYVQANLALPLGLLELAQQAGMSRYQFTRSFSRINGQSPYQYVLQARLERARHLLQMSAMSIAEVALATGFSSQSHFTSVCRRLFGKTPGMLRGLQRER